MPASLLKKKAASGVGGCRDSRPHGRAQGVGDGVREGAGRRFRERVAGHRGQNLRNSRRPEERRHQHGPPAGVETDVGIQRIPGLALGSIYALGAVGISMIFGILRFAHFAHGDVMTLGIEREGLRFVGPASETVHTMGNKLSAREVARKAGVPLVPVVMLCSALAARALGSLHDREAIEGLINLTGSDDEPSGGSGAVALTLDALAVPANSFGFTDGGVDMAISREVFVQVPSFHGQKGCTSSKVTRPSWR